MDTVEDVPGGSVVASDANAVPGADGQRGGGRYSPWQRFLAVPLYLDDCVLLPSTISSILDRLWVIFYQRLVLTLWLLSGFLGKSSSISTPSNNPQATVPEGLNTATVTTLAPALSALPALPAIPSSVPIAILRPSARNHISSPLLRGPIPQKGSGQDRFRQQLLKESDYAHLTAADQSRLFTVPITTGTIQRLTATPQRYCAWPAVLLSLIPCFVL